MIRLDGNSLAAFRGAGVAGTVQSVAGCELFGAARSPKWASPYSAQATAALKAQFPTQWPTIRDYGFAHPEIVGYMNAYAPEDAKIAYSLVPTLNVYRWLVGNGSSWLLTGIDTAAHQNWEIEGLVKAISSYSNKSLWGSQSYHDGYYDCFLVPYGSQTNLSVYDGGGSTSLGSIGTNTPHVVTAKYINGVTSAWLDGVKKSERTAAHRPIGTGDCAIFTNHQQSQISPTAFTYFKATGDGVKVREMYPFIRKINGVDTCGMIDVLSGTFYQNAGSGSFTISDSPA